MKPYPNSVLQQYIEAYHAEKMTDEIESAANDEVDRINKQLSELWPALCDRLQQFHPAFEEWVRACIEQVEIIPTYKYIDWDFHVYQTTKGKNEEIWYSDEVKFTDLPLEVADELKAAILKASKITLFNQLTDVAKAKDWNTEQVFDEDFMSIIKPEDEVFWYYTTAYDRDTLWLFEIDIDDLRSRDYCLHDAWRIVKDLLPADIACLIDAPLPQRWGKDHVVDGAPCAFPYPSGTP